MAPNQCWKLESIPNYVTVQLRYRIEISHIALGQNLTKIDWKNSNKDAPNEFEIYV